METPYTSIFKTLFPMLRAIGFNDDELNMLISKNIERAFSIKKKPARFVGNLMNKQHNAFVYSTYSFFKNQLYKKLLFNKIPFIKIVIQILYIYIS